MTAQEREYWMRENPVLRWMSENRIKWSRKNYLKIAYLGQPPKDWDAETEMDIPFHMRAPELQAMERSDRRYLRRRR